MIPLGILASSIRVTLSDVLLAPTNLTASLIGGLVNLAWTDLNTNETGHRVYRSSSPMDTQALPPPVAELGPDVTEWEDTDTPVDQVTYYIVSAVRGTEEAFSSEVMIDTEATYDPHWANVVALLHFDGSLTKNESGSDFAVYGTPTLVQGKFGDAIFADFNYGVLSQHSDFIFGTADFTIECFWKPLGVNRTVFAFNVAGGSGHTIWQSGTGLSFWNGSGNAIASSQVATSDAYHHIAFVRSANVSYLFLDGVLVGSAAYPTNLTGNGIRTGNLNNVNPAGGAIDEFRVTKGVARYTENFTPPTEPFPNQ